MNGLIQRLTERFRGKDYVPPKRVKCIFCDFAGYAVSELREHSAMCRYHPLMARAAVAGFLETLVEHLRAIPRERCQENANA